MFQALPRLIPGVTSAATALIAEGDFAELDTMILTARIFEILFMVCDACLSHFIWYLAAIGAVIYCDFKAKTQQFFKDLLESLGKMPRMALARLPRPAMPAMPRLRRPAMPAMPDWA